MSLEEKKNVQDASLTFPTSRIPLYVDVDETLVRSDLLYEGALQLIKKSPIYFFLLPLWLIKGKAFLKRKMGELVSIVPEHLPYNNEVLDYIVEQKKQGRTVTLASASPMAFVRPISEYIGLGADCLASDANINLIGKSKRDAIITRENKGSFAYAGDNHKDISIWESSSEIIAVGVSNATLKKIKALEKPLIVFPKKKAGLKTWIKQLRIYQWLKNLLLFVPLLTSHTFLDTDKIVLVCASFIAFGCVASATYVINDILDIESDRQHPKKRQRPIASCQISILSGVAMAIFLLLLGFTFSWIFLPGMFFAMLGLYTITTLSYSLHFKQKLLLDVLLLAGLYTLRIFAGAMAIDVHISFWLLSFSMFIFFSLALVKRCSELYLMQANQIQASPGRGYQVQDYHVIQVMGIASSYTAILVLALYLDTSFVRENYKNPDILWILCPLLWYWLNKIWIHTSRGTMQEDPILFSLHDKESWIVAGLLIFFFILSIF